MAGSLTLTATHRHPPPRSEVNSSHLCPSPHCSRFQELQAQMQPAARGDGVRKDTDARHGRLGHCVRPDSKSPIERGQPLLSMSC